MPTNTDNEHTNATNDMSSVGVKAAIASAVDVETRGLKANRDEILKEKKALADSLKRFDGLDADEVRKIMANIEQNEETKLIASGKIDEVLTARQAVLKKHYSSELKVRDDEIKKLTDTKNSLNTRLSDLEIGIVLRDAAAEQKLLPSAVDDAVFQGRALFSRQGDGSLAIVDSNGIIKAGPDGQSPIQPKEWLTGLKDTKTHWWAQSNGTGATGGAGSHNAGKTISRTNLENLSQRERTDFFNDGGRIS